MRHFWPQDARRPLERPTSLLTAPSGPETVLSRNRRRGCRLVMLHGPGCIPLHETCPGTHRRHARCALHKQASSETHTHTLTAPQSHVAQKPRSRHRSTSTSALHCTAHPPTLSYTRPEEASAREGDEAPAFQPLRKAAERCPESQPSGPWPPQLPPSQRTRGLARTVMAAGGGQSLAASRSAWAMFDRRRNRFLQDTGKLTHTTTPHLWRRPRKALGTCLGNSVH